MSETNAEILSETAERKASSIPLLEVVDLHVQFETSRGQDPAFSFTIGAGQVIPGWDQGLIGMKQFGLRRLVIPPSLAGADLSDFSALPSFSFSGTGGLVPPMPMATGPVPPSAAPSEPSVVPTPRPATSGISTGDAPLSSPAP